MKIELGIRNLKRSVNLKIDYEKSLAILNGKEVVFDVQKFAKKLLVIVSRWQSEMINPAVLDGCSYFVNVDNGEDVAKFVGANKFPDNFDELIALLEEVGIW